MIVLTLTVLGGTGLATAQEEQEGEEKKKRWSNATELSLVVTEGNSNTETVGFRENLGWKTERAKTGIKLNATLSNTADDRFRQVDPGVTWVPGETPINFTTSLVEPATEPDVEKYFAEGRYDRKISEKFTWNAGLSWDRNLDAGILSRTIFFAGVGNIWLSGDDHKFRTSYSWSETNREEENPDPEKEEKFGGIRLHLYYMKKWFGTTTLDFDWTVNTNIEDAADWSADLLQGIAVSINKTLALKFSLQFLYNNEPALEDIDLVAQVDLVDPDGIPGSGDEFFVTVESGGVEIELGEMQERKKPLDTVINTSLVINF
jgi:putative salt-induced outer membrane protein YdiY